MYIRIYICICYMYMYTYVYIYMNALHIYKIYSKSRYIPYIGNSL